MALIVGQFADQPEQVRAPSARCIRRPREAWRRGFGGLQRRRVARCAYCAIDDRVGGDIGHAGTARRGIPAVAMPQRAVVRPR